VVWLCGGGLALWRWSGFVAVVWLCGGGLANLTLLGFIRLFFSKTGSRCQRLGRKPEANYDNQSQSVLQL